MRGIVTMLEKAMGITPTASETVWDEPTITAPQQKPRGEGMVGPR